MSIFQTYGLFYDGNFWFCSCNTTPTTPPVYSDVNYLNSLKFTTERIIFFLNESQWIMTMLLGASEKDAYRGGVTKPGFSWVIFELLKIILIINMVV